MSGPAAPRSPDRAALVIAVLLAVLAAVIFVETRAMKVTPAYARIGPTTFPYAIAAGLAVLAVLTAISAWRGRFPERETEHFGPIAWIVGGLLLQMVLLKPAGFSIATGCLFALTAAGFGRRRLWITLPMGIVFSLIVWAIFARVLHLSLPAGPLERLVP
jgi:putative tricarboxylic transport membrane protein